MLAPVWKKWLLAMGMILRSMPARDHSISAKAKETKNAPPHWRYPLVKRYQPGSKHAQRSVFRMARCLCNCAVVLRENIHAWVTARFKTLFPKPESGLVWKSWA